MCEHVHLLPNIRHMKPQVPLPPLWRPQKGFLCLHVRQLLLLLQQEEISRFKGHNLPLPNLKTYKLPLHQDFNVPT